MDEEIVQLKPKRQIINEYLEINGSIDSFYSSISFIQKPAKYHSLGILGPNKSGKSSLMNSIFGTQFPLHINSKHSKGIFMSYFNDKKWLLIDNEGLDSSSRDEESKIYYDYVSSILLFFLCDIIIINILYTDIGRYSASCYDTITLFYHQALIDKDKASFSKKKIVYVIRDFDKKRHKHDAVTRLIKDDLSALWFNKHKTHYLSFEDFFVLDIVTIPSYFHQRLDYDNELEQFKTRILSNAFINNIPLRSITESDPKCNSFKEALIGIVNNIKSQYSFYQSHPRNLMIFYHSLNHKEQVNAQFKEYLNEFYIKSMKLLPNFKLEALELRRMILKEFDAKGIVYNEKLCFTVRKELDEEISHSLYRAFLRQIYASMISTQMNMSKTILSIYDKLEPKDYFASFDNLIDEAMNSYLVSLIEKKVYDKEWIFRIDKPESIYSEHYHLIKKLYLLLHESVIFNRLSNAFDEMYLQIVNDYHNTSEVFWSKINHAFQSTVSECLLVEEERIRSLDKFTEENIQVSINKIKEKSHSIAKERYIHLINHKICKMAINLFEQKMMYEDCNCSSYRQFNQFDDYEIDSLAWKYSSFYITVFDIMRYFKLEPISKPNEYQFNILSSFTSNCTEIINKEKIADLKSRFGNKVKIITQEIKFQSRNTKASVPTWLWILMLLLGRSTAIYIITTKWLIVLLVFCGTYIILIQMRLTFIFRSTYYSFESNIRKSVYDLLWKSK